jgi:LysM repeat protein
MGILIGGEEMKLHKSWLYPVVLLLIASFLLVACERPLPGGYNDPEAGADTTVPEVPQDVPGVDSESYPAEEVPAASDEAAPEEAESAPEDAADSAEAYPAEEQEFAAEGEEAAPEGEAAVGAETSAEEAPADEAAVDEAAVDEAAAEEAPAEAVDAEEAAVEETAETPGIVDPANLSVGQVLVIPGADSAAAEAVEGEEAAAVEETTDEAAAADASATEATEETTDEAAAAVDTTDETAAVEETTAEDGTVTYIVQEGDNLFRIGLNYGVDWTEIAALNGIVGAEIHPGMELLIPAAVDAAAETGTEAAGETDAEAPAQEAVTGEETTYVVQEGDTIYSVAFERGIPWTAIVESNNIEAPYTLEVGQTLIIMVPAPAE